VLKTPICINPSIVRKWAVSYAVRNCFIVCKVMHNFWETVSGTRYQPCKASQPPTVLFYYAQSCQYPFCSGENNCNSGWRQFVFVFYYAEMSSYYITILILCTLLWQIKCSTLINMLSYNNIEHCQSYMLHCDYDCLKIIVNCDLRCHGLFCPAISVLNYLWIYVECLCIISIA